MHAHSAVHVGPPPPPPSRPFADFSSFIISSAYRSRQSHQPPPVSGLCGGINLPRRSLRTPLHHKQDETQLSCIIHCDKHCLYLAHSSLLIEKPSLVLEELPKARSWRQSLRCKLESVQLETRGYSLVREDLKKKKEEMLLSCILAAVGSSSWCWKPN